MHPRHRHQVVEDLRKFSALVMKGGNGYSFDTYLDPARDYIFAMTDKELKGRAADICTRLFLLQREPIEKREKIKTEIAAAIDTLAAMIETATPNEPRS